MATFTTRKRRPEDGGPGSETRGPGTADADPIEAGSDAAPADASDGDGTGRPTAAAAPGATDEAVAAEDAPVLTLDDDTAPDETPAQRARRIQLENLAKGREARHSRLRARVREGRPRPPADEGEKPAAGRTKRADFRLDKAAVAALLDIVDAMTSAQLGDRARFNDRERGLIEPSLGRIIARMTPDAAAKFSQLADPLMLGTGLLLWGLRVFGPGHATERERPGPRPVPIRPDAAAQPAPASPGPLEPNGVAPPPDDLSTLWDIATP